MLCWLGGASGISRARAMAEGHRSSEAPDEQAKHPQWPSTYSDKVSRPGGPPDQPAPAQPSRRGVTPSRGGTRKICKGGPKNVAHQQSSRRRESPSQM